MRAIEISGLVLTLFLACCGSTARDADAPQTDGEAAGADNVAEHAEHAADAEKPAESASSTTPCQSDEDCVPATCCHPKTCVDKSAAPKDCAEMMCSDDCAEGTMDCGKGRCGCTEGACVVNWAE